MQQYWLGGYLLYSTIPNVQHLTFPSLPRQDSSDDDEEDVGHLARRDIRVQTRRSAAEQSDLSGGESGGPTSAQRYR